MTSRHSVTYGLMLGASLAFASDRSAVSAPPRSSSGVVVIALRQSCAVAADEVLLSDVARVDTTNASLKSRIEALDIIDTPSWGESAAIPVKLIEFRLRLAGIDPSRVSIHGSQVQVMRVDSQVAANERAFLVRAADSQRVTAGTVDTAAARVNSNLPRSREPDTDDVSTIGQSLEDVVLNAAKKAVLNQLPWNKEDITFRLAQSIRHEVSLAESSERCTCTAQLRSSGPPIGRVNVDVTVTSDDHASIEIPVALDVRHYDTVVSTARPLVRGRKIQKDDLYLHRWDVTGATDYCTDPDQLIGRVAGRTLSAAQLVREQDLDRRSASETGPDRPVMIKRGNRVKLIAKIGDLNITVAGEAMQDGKVGETIRVQNVESKSIVQGRVLSADEVEIAY